MRVLITSPRAPVALDLARRFHAHGDDVFFCDSLRFGCGRFSRSCNRNFLVPQPRKSPQGYLDAINNVIDQADIEFLVPTCEEVFYLAKYRDQIHCEVFVDSHDKLEAIHNKWSFSQNASNDFAQAPDTFKINSQEQLKQYSEHSDEFVFKPVYSRFASETLIQPTPTQLARCSFGNGKRWIAQRFIRGQEYSTYCVARDGALLAQACYQSEYRAGRGAGIYFRSVTNDSIAKFVEQFVAKFCFTGQIGFDCIVDKDDRVWVIEANPRATSGVHLLDDQSPLVDAILGKTCAMIEATQTQPQMLGMAMPIWGLANAVASKNPVRALRQMIGDFFRGRDVVFRWRDPLPALGLPITLAELFWISVSQRITLQQATTHDIEWNGEPY